MWLVVLLAALGVARIAATYPMMSQAWDESLHVGAGMERLASGKYQAELIHPPLARVAGALPLYLAGKRWQGASDIDEQWDEGRRLLYADGHWWRNLTLAR